MKDINIQEFGNRLAELRREKHLTQDDMANRLGITPQALSKWERGSSCPDLYMTVQICSILETSADYLLGIHAKKITEDGNEKTQEQIWQNLREGLEGLELIIGEGIVPAFQGENFVQKVTELRIRLSKEGILLPLLHIKDMSCIQKNEYMILAYQNVLCSEKIDSMTDKTLDEIMSQLEETVRKKYDEIINVDITKSLVDNLKLEYPALIEGMVPGLVSYGLLTEVCKEVLKRGNGLIYLPKILEALERELRKNPQTVFAELVESVCKEIERDDNFWIMLKNRHK